MTTLETIAAGRYVVFTPSIAVEGCPNMADAPDGLLIPCAMGVIGIAPDGRLTARVHRHGPAARRLRQIPGVEVITATGGFLVLVFDAEQFEAVAQVVRPRLLPSRPVRRSFAEVSQ